MHLCQWFLVEDMILLLLVAVGMPRPERARRTAHSSHWGIHKWMVLYSEPSLLRFLDSKRFSLPFYMTVLVEKKSAKHTSF